MKSDKKLRILVKSRERNLFLFFFCAQLTLLYNNTDSKEIKTKKKKRKKTKYLKTEEKICEICGGALNL